MSESIIVRYAHKGGEIPDYHELIWLGDVVTRDRAGRPHKHGHTLWALVVCNNPGCPAEVLVAPDVVAKSVNR